MDAQRRYSHLELSDKTNYGPRLSNFRYCSCAVRHNPTAYDRCTEAIVPYPLTVGTPDNPSPNTSLCN
jgi:hypothetical protein